MILIVPTTSLCCLPNLTADVSTLLCGEINPDWPNPLAFFSRAPRQMENTAKVVPHYNSISTVSRLAAINIQRAAKTRVNAYK